MTALYEIAAEYRAKLDALAELDLDAQTTHSPSARNCRPVFRARWQTAFLRALKVPPCDWRPDGPGEAFDAATCGTRWSQHGPCACGRPS
jgi:hypothetical protein